MDKCPANDITDTTNPLWYLINDTELRSRLTYRLRCEISHNFQSVLDPEDVLQEVALEMMEKERKANDENHSRRLLYKIVMNKMKGMIQALRAQKRGGDNRVESLNIERDSSTSNAKPTFDEVNDMLTVLEPGSLMHKVCGLRIMGYEVSEVAVELGKSKRTIERCLQEARKLLTAKLDLNLAI